MTTDVDMTWIEKYLTYEQDRDGTLRLTDVHFLAEIVFDHARPFEQITATLRSDGGSTLATYGPRDLRAFTNGAFYTRKTLSFPDVPSLESRFPPSTRFTWEINGPSGRFQLAPLCLGGPDARTCFPRLSTIRLKQGGSAVADFQRLDAHASLEVEWNTLTTDGPRLTRTLWSDFTFLLISNQQGEVVFTGGAPNDTEPFLNHTATSAIVPAGTLSPGEEYVVFISQVHAVDHSVSEGIQQLAQNSFAVEAAVRTAGSSARAITAPARKAQYLWSRKTRGTEPETWPTLTDYWS